LQAELFLEVKDERTDATTLDLEPIQPLDHDGTKLELGQEISLPLVDDSPLSISGDTQDVIDFDALRHLK
jgi:hypothetical protein